VPLLTTVNLIGPSAEPGTDRELALPMTLGLARRAWVTGASRGLGLAIALALAEAGADLAITARSREALEPARLAIEARGRRCLVVPAHVEDEDQVNAVIDDIASAWGGLDILVTAAGISPTFRPMLDQDSKHWRRTLSVNLDGTYNCLRAAATTSIRAGTPLSIVVLSSVHARRAAENLAAYGASKAAVESLVRTASREWAPHAIRINALAPGYVTTDMTASLLSSPERSSSLLERVATGRFAEPREVATAALYLLSADAGYVTGTTLTIDGGWLTQ
jgi:NAD(P)-dependent dehydrogenase (short-subunit alcohol dehydrogenase family)